MDQDRFYDDEEMQDNMPPKDNRFYGDGEDNGDLEMLFNFLMDALTQASAVPLTNKRLVNVDMCLDTIEDIRRNLPEAILYSQQIIDERDRILHNAEGTASAKISAANARADSAIDDADQRAQQIVGDAEERARKILDDAEMRARAMIDQSEIMRHAREEAVQLLNNARADANEQRLAATRYAEELLRDLEKDLQMSVDAVRRSRQNIGKEQ